MEEAGNSEGGSVVESLTAHCMVRNEPFVYYAVKSVYPYVDRILLYDTGSYDKYTLEDIQVLLREDIEKKIIFKEVPIEIDETMWSCRKDHTNYRRMAKENQGKKGKWFVRRQMIDDTETKYFMILDGDEVYYQIGIYALIRSLYIWPENKLCGFVPLTWFKDLRHTFRRTHSGRVFVTDAIGMTPKSPGEFHTVKSTGQAIGRGSPCSFDIKDVFPFAHFETYLKPWRRDVDPNKIKDLVGPLPEVMEDEPYFIERFQNESSH